MGIPFLKDEVEVVIRVYIPILLEVIWASFRSSVSISQDVFSNEVQDYVSFACLTYVYDISATLGS